MAHGISKKALNLRKEYSYKPYGDKNTQRDGTDRGC